MEASAIATIYTVTAWFAAPDVASEFLDWLLGSHGRRGHVAEVVAAGAISAEVLTGEDGRQGRYVEVRYRFANQSALDAYVAEHAPRLREDGLRRFPPDRGVRFDRRVGTLVAIRGGVVAG